MGGREGGREEGVVREGRRLMKNAIGTDSDCFHLVGC